MERRSIDDIATAAAGLLRDPVWKLVMVSQEGSGPCEECGISLDDLEEPTHCDFAYTVGLHERFGRSEVHCPGISVDEDPASLTYETLADFVNVIAAGTAAKEIGPGSEVGGNRPSGRPRSDGDPGALDGRRVGVLLQAAGVLTATTLVATTASKGNER